MSRTSTSTGHRSFTRSLVLKHWWKDEDLAVVTLGYTTFFHVSTEKQLRGFYVQCEMMQRYFLQQLQFSENCGSNVQPKTYYLQTKIHTKVHKHSSSECLDLDLKVVQLSSVVRTTGRSKMPTDLRLSSHTSLTWGPLSSSCKLCLNRWGWRNVSCAVQKWGKRIIRVLS